MHHPFSSISSEKLWRYFWPLVVLAVLTMAVLNLAGAPLTTDAAPAGIVSYEFAGNVTQAENILASWDSVARERAAFVQGMDFLFIPIYAGAIALGCIMASKVLLDRGWGLASIGTLLAWLIYFAGLLDVVENIALVVMLFGTPANPWPQIAYWCAAPKFFFVALGFLYSLLGGISYLFMRRN